MSMNIAIIGTGSIARHHAKAIKNAKGATVGGVLSRDEGRANAFVQEFGGTPYTDLQKLLADDSIDAVSICTPSGAHMEPAVQAAAAGKHIIVEKPLEITRPRCDTMIEAAGRHNVTLSCIFQSRFFENAQLTHQAVQAGRFGKLVMGDASIKFYRTQAYYDDGGWKGTLALDGGGALMNQGIHGIDLLLWLMGPVDAVQARTAILGHERIEVEDAAVATVEFKNGALGTIQGSTATYPGFLKRVEISGTHGGAVLVEEDLKTWSFAEETEKDQEIRDRFATATRSGGGAADPMAIDTVGHTRNFEDFIRSCETGQPSMINGTEAKRSVDLILAIYESAKAGKRIRL